jgi:ABC-type multidrug transport system fused ATPase/permease subunit
MIPGIKLAKYSMKEIEHRAMEQLRKLDMTDQALKYPNQLSGGQRQRLGIARALFTAPKLLILDEATSALDAETESLISQTIKELKGKCTVILIAHRLSSVMNADKVIFMENGKITAEGTFSEVRKLSPNFEKQAKLMGITDNN